jgi:hypothetical protein
VPIFTGLPAALLDPAKWSFRGTVQPYGGGSVEHQSDYDFVLTK